MGLLDTAVTVLADTLLSTAGESVTYARGATTGSLTMLRGETEFEGYSADDHEFSGKTVDWLIEPADLTLDAPVGNTLPEIGDKITDANSQVYKVVMPGGERHYRYTDQTEKLLRIHTVRVT